MTTKKHKLPVLVSYAFLREMGKQSISRFLNMPGLEILLDSGAFTALNSGYEIKLSEYIDFLHQWRSKLFGYMALDKLQDPKTTAANLRAMVSEGLKPIPVHVFGDDEAKMDELFELSDWIALGGFRRPRRGWSPMSYVKQKMEWARGRKVHWLGYTKAPMLRAFKPFSCDCSNFAAGQRWGFIQIYCGNGVWCERPNNRVMSDRLFMMPEIQAAARSYEIPVEWLADPVKWKGARANDVHHSEAMTTLFGVRSWIRYSLEFKQRFGVRIFLAILPAMHAKTFETNLAFADARGWTVDARAA